MDDALKTSYRFCADLSRREARNFYYSFVLLPPTLRRSMCALYAFSRHTDDLVDEAGTLEVKRAALDHWRASIDRALTGSPGADWPGLAALADTVRRHAIPRRYIEAVIDGVEMDLEPRRFPTFEDLRGYCDKVASAVGLCCIHIWGFRSEGGRAEDYAEACGVALQVTNILRDIREDAELGRIYLPEEDMERFGVQPEDLLATTPNDRVRALVAFEAERASALYEQAKLLGPLVSPVGRPVLATIAGIYHALLREIIRRDFDVMSQRVSLPKWRKLAIALGSLGTRLARSSASAAGTELPRC
ncbi:phytoene/squalene synthase family protein [Singulisphaera sp. PoT]|uniref:phytoene/squalene synthase family protein n=1 Tax=Singulisphaera sp. PoT TaxID=3411797 RepID=UPI003BF50AD6